MLHSFLTLPNFWWLGDESQPPLDADDMRQSTGETTPLNGQFSLGLSGTGSAKAILIRDRLGVNKLFFAVRRNGEVVAANYIADLTRRGVPPESIYSVPAGACVEIDGAGRTLEAWRYFRPGIDEDRDVTMNQAAREIAAELDGWFARLAVRFPEHRVLLCMSGGVDSGLVAAFARRHFESLTAYTYSLAGPGQGSGLSEDASAAQRLAEFMDIPWRLVRVTVDDVLDALTPALVYGQDWRDFNVHCAIVNEILARAMKEDLIRSGTAQPVIVLTGDVMNELVADYSPVEYRGQQYYTLPRLPHGQLRLALVRGLDAGDREVGVFGRHGLQAVQPYALLSAAMLRIPSSLLSAEDSKQQLAHAVAADILPDWLLRRRKVRAQIGSRAGDGSVLSLLVDRGCDASRLRRMFCDSLRISHETFPADFIRVGTYRSLRRYPTRECRDDYLTQ